MSLYAGYDPDELWEPGDDPDGERATWLASRANPDTYMECGCWEGGPCPHEEARAARQRQKGAPR